MQNDLLGCLYCQGAAFQDLGGPAFGHSQNRLRLGGDLVHQPHGLSFVGRKEPTGKEDAHRQMVGQASRQLQHATGIGQQPTTGFGQAELRLLRRDDEIAAQGHLEPATDGIPVHGGDDRFVAAVEDVHR